MKRVKISVAAITLVLMGMVNVFGSEKTSTGFYYPTKTNDFGFYAGWLSDSCGEGGTSIHGHGGYGKDNAGLYHIGKDIAGYYGSPVYAISDGIVLDVNASASWGGGSARGLFVKHRLIDGSEFVMLYGHVATSLVKGNRVVAGQQIATIAITDLPHVHSGISPGSDVPASPWGRVFCDEWPYQGKFLNPINWIETKTPLNTTGHPNGSLLFDVTTGYYWRIEEGKRWIVPPQYLLYPNYFTRNVVKVSPLEVACYEEAGIFYGKPMQGWKGFAEGDMLRFDGDPQEGNRSNVYIISEGRLRWLRMSADAFLEDGGYQWENVHVLGDAIDWDAVGMPLFGGDFQRCTYYGVDNFTSTGTGKYVAVRIGPAGGVGGGFEGVPAFVFGSPADMPNDYVSTGGRQFNVREQFSDISISSDGILRNQRLYAL